MCARPFTKKMENGQEIPLPCGKCATCKKKRVSHWSFRLMQQEKVSESAFFVTLTINTEFMPITKNGFMTLDKTILQKYFKRLRKLEHGKKISYYAVGEYGTKTKRPHFHIILFNATPQNIEQAWTINNHIIGLVHIGNVSGASIGYTLKYINKIGYKQEHARDDRAREFSLMSKGIGACYLTPQMVAWHKADMYNRYYATNHNFKTSFPRYYKNKIYTDEEKEQIAQHFETFHKHRTAEAIKKAGSAEAYDMAQRNKSTTEEAKLKRGRLNETF